MKNVSLALLTAFSVFVWSKQSVADIGEMPKVSVIIYEAARCGPCRVLKTKIANETGSPDMMNVDGQRLRVVWLDINSNPPHPSLGVYATPTTLIIDFKANRRLQVLGSNLEEVKRSVRFLQSQN